MTNVSELSDADLAHQSISKPELFEELVERYERAFIRKAASILNNEEDARDAVQETFIRIYISVAKFKVQEGADFSSWAYKILVNQCYTLYRKLHRGPPVSLNLDSELAEIIPDQAGLDEIEHRLTADYVLRILSKLPVLLRHAVELHFIEGVPQKEIARREGVSNGVVRSRIHRAKHELRKLHLQLETITKSS